MIVLLMLLITIVVYLYNNSNFIKVNENFTTDKELEDIKQENAKLKETISNLKQKYKKKVSDGIKLLSKLNTKVDGLDNNLVDIAEIVKHNTITTCLIQKHSEEMDSIDS
tara:strand:+ start:243 stop:572 length:330 start_codon:yes stop_codon:yes gene_type:complete